jgi:hypothetical protein
MVHMISGLSYAFVIESVGHPFAICDADTAEPLKQSDGSLHTFVHISLTGVVTTGDAANAGKESGTLIWTVPADFDGAVYRSLHLGANGVLRCVNLDKLAAMTNDG